ncbi:MAG TPA: LacI family DNA-binding transcriptional regulator [Bryobacteraceae bacterium]|nr:LacI family DNA-binding transcriptional regulator [Bryobacteraceae bacterium]
MNPRRPTTLADIARELGITPAAVSKALRGALDISAETRRRVAEKAEQMNYRVNLTARSLSSRSTKLIGVVVPTFLHSFFGDVLTAATAVLDTRGFQPIMTCTDERAEQEAKQIDILLSRQTEGLLVATCQSDDRYGVFARARDLRVPVILMARNLNPPVNSWVGSDNVTIGLDATNHLIHTGRQRIAHVYGPVNSSALLRIEGYKQALRNANMRVREEYILGGNETDVVAERCMQDLLRLSNPPDAVFCYNDAMAAACMRVAMGRGINVPDDVAFVGVGNTRFSDVFWSPLTTIDQRAARIGEIAATNLLKAIDNEAETGTVYVKGDLIVRESCGSRQAAPQAAH